MRRVAILLGGLIVFGFLSGCSTRDYLTIIDGFNALEIQSCLEYHGSVNIGSAAGALRGVTVTGGASLELCKEVLSGRPGE